MKKILLSALALGAAAIAALPAEAAQGCGAGLHRGPHGRCLPNRGPGFRRGGPVVGSYHSGRGYWDGHRYWQHRYRAHNGWRYR